MSESKSLGLWKMIIILMMVIGFNGCISRYVITKGYPLKDGMVSGLTGNQSLTIVNAQTSPGMGFKTELLAKTGAVRWFGNLGGWTDTAVVLLRSELEKRGFNVTNDAPKKLSLSITRAKIYQGFSAMRCILYLRVETGEGYTKEFEGNNASGVPLVAIAVERACDGAITRAVAAALNDQNIRSYLE